MSEIIFGLLIGIGVFFFVDRVLGKRLKVRDAWLALAGVLALLVAVSVVQGAGFLLDSTQRTYMDKRLLFWCSVAIGYSLLCLPWRVRQIKGKAK